VGIHLGKAYLATGQRALAEKTFAMAAATGQPLPEARQQLAALVGGGKALEDRIRRATEALIAERTLTLPGKRPTVQAMGEFLLLLAPGGKVLDVQFLTGDEGLKKLTGTLKALDHQVPIPPREGTRLVRRAVVVADPSSQTTTLIFMTSESFMSLPKGMSPKPKG
ncbi:MAG TPA: hypothetical protein VJ570_00030, partial [Holophagaceae bacterium]|nr:hypothetical protein [Holophagaceae bacterium]